MSVRDLTPEQIKFHLKNDTIKRNEKLSVLMNWLDSLDASAVFAIDGRWGSGKTVFVKQLCMLADESEEAIEHSAIDTESVEQLQETHKVFYFNAWESDYINDPLSALLLKLIAEDDESLNEASLKRALKMINPSEGIKTVTKGFIDPNAKVTKEKLVSDVKDIVDRQKAVNDIIDSVKNDKPRMLFVVDELDRCRPSFAVDLLEVIKHYFGRDDIAFIISTNTKELVHTIKKYYGHSFDASSYLNKFFDFTFNLQPVNVEDYARAALKWEAKSMVADEVAFDAIKYFGFEMREINAYCSAVRLIENYLRRDGLWQQDEWTVQLIFVPLALALKVKNSPEFNDFISGKGAEVLNKFLLASPNSIYFGERLIQDRSAKDKAQIKKESIELLSSQYKQLFEFEGRWPKHEGHQSFLDAVSLISNYTTIKEQVK